MANRALIEKEIKEFCRLNDITDVAGFTTQCLLTGFNTFKYGTSPGDNVQRQEKGVEFNNRDKKPKVEGIKTDTNVETKPVTVKKTSRKVKIINN